MPVIDTKNTDAKQPETSDERCEQAVEVTLWKLRFARSIHPPDELVFSFINDKVKAIQRGREHCLRMNYKFISVRPFLVSLDRAEKALAEGRFE
jgi:hypothetical protein